MDKQFPEDGGAGQKLDALNSLMHPVALDIEDNNHKSDQVFALGDDGSVSLVAVVISSPKG